MNSLVFVLKAPLQAYGNAANYNYRTSGQFPRKSAILGLIAAALGYARTDTAKLQKLNQLQVAVRMDQQGSAMTDFQTVKWHHQKPSKLSYRTYLQDAVATVALSSTNAEFLDEIAYALRHPKFQLFVGRKSAPLAGVMPLFKYETTDPVEALAQTPWQGSKWYLKQHANALTCQVIAEKQATTDRVTWLNTNQAIDDVPQSFDPAWRKYGYRHIAVGAMTATK